MLTIQIDQIEWPVIIRHQASPEFTYIKNRSHWDETVDSSAWLITEGDHLIDYKGICYAISTIDKKFINALDCNEIELVTLIAYLKAHMHNRGICCLSKLNVSNVASAFEIIESVEEE